MYIQITDNCNMTCAHCCFSCGPRKRNFMTFEVFSKCIEFANQTEDIISIGGGEPTCHPKFWEFLWYALINYNAPYEENRIWMATNGKKTEDALKLLNLTKKGIIAAVLSQDIYHEDIDYEVIKGFSSIKALNEVSRIVSSGRARFLYESEKRCACPDLFVDPKGNVFSCGCRKHKFGNILEDSLNWGSIDPWYESKGASIGECVFAKRRR